MSVTTKNAALESGDGASPEVFTAVADVTDFTVHLRGVVLRFDFRKEPLETVDLNFHFQREVHKKYVSGG